jgi:membrane-bound ClpP family serine protease
MNIFAFIFILIAAILFAVEFFRSQWQNFIALGLMFLSLGFIWQYASNSHSFHF